MVWPSSPVVESTEAMLVPPATSVFAAAAALVSWRTFTASVSASPAFTFLICRPFMSALVLVRTGPPVTVIPVSSRSVSPMVIFLSSMAVPPTVSFVFSPSTVMLSPTVSFVLSPSMVMPSPTVTDLFTWMLSTSSISFASLIFRALPSASTPMLLSLRAPVAPPVTFRVSPNLMALLVPVSPANVRPAFSALFRVALVASLRSTL